MGILRKVTDSIQGKAPLSVSRSSKWPKVREEYLKDHPACAVCGGRSKIEVHHVKSFHVHPELELDPTNLISLCESSKNGIICHLFVGHLGNYKSVNVHVREDSVFLNKRLKERA